jgi:hypothetical protein
MMKTHAKEIMLVQESVYNPLNRVEPCIDFLG